RADAACVGALPDGYAFCLGVAVTAQGNVTRPNEVGFGKPVTLREAAALALFRNGAAYAGEADVTAAAHVAALVEPEPGEVYVQV
ncbi:unnamed protein product, partial [Adineta ricciae]